MRTLASKKASVSRLSTPYPPGERTMANSPHPSRREFLKTSATGAVTLAGLSIARSAHAAGKQEIKIGMIGCGGRCSGAAEESLQAGPDVKLAAMCDIFPDRLQFKYNWFKKNHARPGHCRPGSSLRRLRRLQEGDRERRRGADRLRVEVPSRCTRRPPSAPASTSSWRSRTASIRWASAACRPPPIWRNRRT